MNQTQSEVSNHNLNKRKPTDLCLLCIQHNAVKKNSHIFSKFLSTSFLGGKGKTRKGYDLSSDTILNGKFKIIQDSPKEDYILCEDCESYFGIIETIVNDTFLNWKEKVELKDFGLSKITDGIDIIECTNTNSSVIHLFIYSLFWRVAISSDELFKNIQIAKKIEEQLRQTLLDYKHIRKTEFLKALVDKPNFHFFPSSITTATSFADEMTSVLFAASTYEPYSIIVDKFSFTLSSSVEKIVPTIMQKLCNVKIEDCRIILFSEDLWQENILNSPYELLAKEALRLKKQV